MDYIGIFLVVLAGVVSFAATQVALCKGVRWQMAMVIGWLASIPVLGLIWLSNRL